MSVKIEYLAPERIKVGKKPITIVLGVAEGLDDLTPDELRAYNDYLISLNREDEAIKSNWIEIIIRIFVFPFWTAIAFIGAATLFLKWVFNFIRFGGESIAYTDRNSRKTIYDIYNKLNDKL